MKASRRRLFSRVLVIVFMAIAIALGVIGALYFSRTIQDEEVQSQVEEIKREMAPTDTLAAP
jgi:hypothetical protein